MKKNLNLITHFHVDPAYQSDADTMIPAIASIQDQNLKSKELN